MAANAAVNLKECCTCGFEKFFISELHVHVRFTFKKWLHMLHHQFESRSRAPTLALHLPESDVHVMLMWSGAFTCSATTASRHQRPHNLNFHTQRVLVYKTIFVLNFKIFVLNFHPRGLSFEEFWKATSMEGEYKAMLKLMQQQSEQMRKQAEMIARLIDEKGQQSSPNASP